MIGPMLVLVYRRIIYIIVLKKLIMLLSDIAHQIFTRLLSSTILSGCSHPRRHVVCLWNSSFMKTRHCSENQVPHSALLTLMKSAYFISAVQKLPSLYPVGETTNLFENSSQHCLLLFNFKHFCFRLCFFD